MTMTPFLPPISSDTRLPSRAPSTAIFVPTPFEPVNDTTSTPACWTIGQPTFGPVP
jgi:hypothetical protein